MSAIAYLFGLAGVLYGLYEYSKSRKLRLLNHRIDSLLDKLYQQGDWSSPQARSTIRQVISAFHQARQIDPEVDRRLDVEKLIVKLADFL